MTTEFDQLAADLEVLAKAQPAATEEDKVLAAAKEAGVDTDAVGETAETGADTGAEAAPEGKKPDGDGDEDDEVLGKSFQATDADGNLVKAYDATDLIKSLGERVAGLESGLENVAERRESLAKSLGSISTILNSQKEQIETLQKAMVTLGNQGSGRKAVLTVTEKPDQTLAKAEPTITPDSFMAKADSAWKAGRITGKDLTTCSVAMRMGDQIDAGLLSKIFAG
jgi:hypothetical protein